MDSYNEIKPNPFLDPEYISKPENREFLKEQLQTTIASILFKFSVETGDSNYPQ